MWRWIDWPGRNGQPDLGIDLVARERDSGAPTAIQCKFYDPAHTSAKGDIDSFFTASGKSGFTNRVIVSTTDRWGKNAEEALDDQTIPVPRINMAEIAESPIDWDIAWPQGQLTVDLAPAVKKTPRPHQVAAIEADNTFATWPVLGDKRAGSTRTPRRQRNPTADQHVRDRLLPPPILPEATPKTVTTHRPNKVLLKVGGECQRGQRRRTGHCRCELVQAAMTFMIAKLAAAFSVLARPGRR